MKEEELSGPTELLQANRKQKKKQRKRNLDEEEADDGTWHVHNYGLRSQYKVNLLYGQAVNRDCRK